MIHYTKHFNIKSKTWVTFVHGAGGSSLIWYKQLREFARHFNVLMVDLRGHGKSKHSLYNSFKKKYTFKFLAQDIIDVLDKEKIKASHFIGISLGTILIRQIAENYPKRIKSMVMAGAIIKLNFRSKILIKAGNAFKSIFPYLWIYKFFAHIIMPKKNHLESRLLFVREAKKLYKKEFMRWYKLTTDLTPVLKLFSQVEVKIPTLYLMGSEDYMFLPGVEKITKEHKRSKLSVIKNSGHVVNIDQPKEFNLRAISFIRRF
tara:strand:- start:2958 stop:3737 length:780 start_codon:yes stop_codon:yes gene_type:complete